MRRTSIKVIGAAIGTVFALALCFGNSVMHAERRGDAQQGQQGQQGQQVQPGQQGQQGQSAPKPPSAGISLRKFVFTLALGDVQAGAGSTFTPAATKALADLKDFLPYKRYTLLDTIYKIGLVGPTAPMKGIDDAQKYELWTSGQGHPDGRRMSVRVNLQSVSQERRASLIETTFDIEIGETVVVGTSRLDGNRALLLLVTSVP